MLNKSQKYIMKFKSISFIALFLISALGLQSQQVPSIIPLPQKIEFGKSEFPLNPKTTIYTNLTGKDRLDFYGYLQQSPFAKEFSFSKTKNSKNAGMSFLLQKSNGKPGSYDLKVSPKGVAVVSASSEGLFYGLQTVLQLIKQDRQAKLVIPTVIIKDDPRFQYRGLMLDVSRHFFSVDFIKKQLDAMAYYKMNRFHWHLTDGPGWRIEIKKYPRLTEFAAWRDHKIWKKWWNSGRKYATLPSDSAFGGYYTQDQIREVVAYATARHITVIPEIEMPGHSEEVLAAYPFLSCAGEPYKNSDFCAGKDSVFHFLEDVLSEVMELFPSEYIHIGGDEAGKEAWKTCPHCRERMEKEGLKNVDELQSYFVNRIGKFINSKGHKLLGWDEIVEGKLPENAAIMSWRGEEGGIKALKTGHPAIMTPGQYCYLDYYQDVPHLQPEAIGGFTPTSKVYSYEPINPQMTTQDAQKLLGVQGNLWTEYVPTPEHAEAMIYPRILALAEIGWTNPERKSWPDFKNRVLQATNILQSKGYHPYDLHHEIGNRPESLTKTNHLAMGKKVTYNSPYSPNYPAGGDSTLTDGYKGGWGYGDKRWQGFITGKRLDVTIDLDTIKEIHSITMTCQQQVGPEIYLPAQVVYAISEDGINFTELKNEEKMPDLSIPTIYQDYKWNGISKGRYVRVTAKATPEHSGWIFTDEIIVK